MVHQGEDAITKALQTLGYDETFDTIMMKMGQMIVNVFDAKISSSDLSINQEITSEIIDNNRNKQSLIINKLDLKKYECYGTKFYSAKDRIMFPTCNNMFGPSILKPTSSFGEIYPKAIAVYQLTKNCGSS